LEKKLEKLFAERLKPLQILTSFKNNTAYPSQMQSSEEKSPELCHLAENPVIPTIPAVSKRLTQRPLLLIETTFSGDLSPKWEMK